VIEVVVWVVYAVPLLLYVLMPTGTRNRPAPLPAAG
jgi:high-affinity iron transporter